MQAPHIPDGTNQSLRLAISPDGTPTVGHRYDIPARCGVAVRLAAGQTLRVISPSGHQVCDFWAFARANLHEHLSMAHIHTSLGSIFPKTGNTLVSNLRQPMLRIIADTSPGVHDTVIACCDATRYQQLGHIGYHDNCADNLRMALMAIGLQAPLVPAPFNIWMNVPVAADGTTHFAAPVSKPADHIDLRAETELIAVMSACPQDMTPVNGEGVAPDGLAFEVLG